MTFNDTTGRASTSHPYHPFTPCQCHQRPEPPGSSRGVRVLRHLTGGGGNGGGGYLTRSALRRRWRGGGGRIYRWSHLGTNRADLHRRRMAVRLGILLFHQ